MKKQKSFPFRRSNEEPAYQNFDKQVSFFSSLIFPKKQPIYAEKTGIAFCTGGLQFLEEITAETENALLQLCDNITEDL